MSDLAFLTHSPNKVSTLDHEYQVVVYIDPEADCWIAESDDLAIATEAETLDKLVQRVWLIAPEIAALNGHKGGLHLRFVLHTSA